MKKKKHIVILILLLLCIYFLLITFLILPKYRSMYTLINLSFWLIIGSGSILIFRLTKVKSVVKYDTSQLVIISLIVYFALTYILAVFFGFQKNPISLNIKSIVQNLLTYGLIIYAEEYLRSVLVKNYSKKFFLLILITLIFTLINVSYDVFNTDFSKNVEVFKFISMTFLPELARNILFTYIAYHVGYVPNLICRGVFELSAYLLPIFPDLGIYVGSLVNFLFPFIVLYIVSNLYLKHEKKTLPIRKRKKANVFIVFAVSLTLVFLALVGGFGSFQIIAIASNSMNPVFYRGDSVIFEKYSKNKELKTGKIIIYDKDGLHVVHRIIFISNDKSYVITKGDNNPSADSDRVYMNQIKGTVKLIIPDIGYPAIWLMELLTE